uniref:DDT domain-containing protein n=1 Tax=Fagus sylvatica TaxID=28930 RepID=A0A2N9G750_FAGSY
MSRQPSPPPIPKNDRSSPETNPNSQNDTTAPQNDTAPTPPVPVNRSNRPSRACTIRAAARLYAAAAAAPSPGSKPKKKDQQLHKQQQQEEDESPQQKEQCSKIVTQLVEPPPPSQLPRWTLRSMWELASVLNFLHVFRPLLNISLEFSAEEFETALITPNDTLSDIHIPLLKHISYTVGDGSRLRFWHDVWCGDLPLRSQFPSLFQLARAPEATVADLCHFQESGREWQTPFAGLLQVGGCLRVAFFVWTSALGKILTTDNLRKRRVIIQDWCCMCKSSGETVNHLLLHCPVAWELWSMVWILFGITWVMPRGVVDLFNCWHGPRSKSEAGKIWKMTPHCLMWCIWQERNDRTFNGVEKSIPALKFHLLHILLSWAKAAHLDSSCSLSDMIDYCSAIPPVTRMALTRDTWVTVLCRKLRDWWHWVADGDLPIVASHGLEVEVYKTLDPGVRVVILKALCDIRVEQEDIRNYIDNSLKHGVQLSAFRKERIGGDSHGISYWYEDDPIVGHRLYREIRKVEVKKAKAKGSQVLHTASYLWETVATNFDEFQDVSEKLFTSKNRTEASLGKKLKIDMLPEIEKVHKRKERLLKKQHRQALLLDNFVSVDGLAPGRSLRDRKPVTYTFDDYDRSINEAIKITKYGIYHLDIWRKQPSPEPPLHRRESGKPEASANGRWSGPSHASQHVNFSAPSPTSPDFDDGQEEHKTDLDRSNRPRQRPQRYSARDFVEAVSDNDADFDSDDEIVGEAIYDDEYLRKRKERRKFSSSSEGDEEYHWDDENAEEEEEEEDDDDSLSISEDSDEPRKLRKLPGRTRRETKLRSVDELQAGLRRSKRATRNRINYRQYELSESETESMKPEKSNASDAHSDASENGEYSIESQDSDGNDNNNDQEMKVDQPVEDFTETAETVEKEQEQQPPEKSNSPGQDEIEGVRKRRFLDLNELAPGSGFDDGLNTVMKDEDTDDL